jgi:hypothetical protein
MEGVIGIIAGVALAAACGFRVFMPLLVSSLAARSGYLELTASFDWLSSDTALVCFIIATVAEVVGYYIPVVDNALDAMASPAAVVAGAVLAGSVMVDVEPWLRWVLAIVAGGGAAGAVQAGTVGTRATSTVTTAGLANPVMATAELGGSVMVALLAIAVPLIAAVCVIAIVIALALRWQRRRALRRAAVSHPGPG